MEKYKQSLIIKLVRKLQHLNFKEITDIFIIK